MKSSLFSLLGDLAKRRPYISFAAVRSALGDSPLVDKPARLREYLSEAMEKRVIYGAGRGWYSSLEKTAILDSEATAPLRSALGKRFPFLPHYVWSTQQVNPWMHHLLGKFVQFVFVESGGEDDVAPFLRNEGWSVVVNPTIRSATEFTPSPRTVVIRGIRRKFNSAAEPRIETVLVDLMLENARLRLMDDGERREMTRKLVTSHRVEMASLLARLGKHHRKLEDLIGAETKPIIGEK
ncbi:MAG: hypothetical protein JJT75_12330 [Opitutales bacterium]|nr:hypothetical protein [Opitutales bacterium]MCH8539800.1 hypothetical protein [Opitutales bacterium]